SGPNPYAAIYEVDLPAKGTVASVRIEFLTDPSFRRYGWLGRHNGNFVLTEVVVELDGKPVPLAAAEADFSQNGFPASHLVDGNDKTGWAVDGARKLENRVAKITLAEPLDLGDV